MRQTSQDTRDIACGCGLIVFLFVAITAATAAICVYVIPSAPKELPPPTWRAAPEKTYPPTVTVEPGPTQISPKANPIPKIDDQEEGPSSFLPLTKNKH